ncbi:MAG: RDD family protein [Pirellulales bacterium]|nr:RDD family protein [Pirellulales bacterium]
MSSSAPNSPRGEQFDTAIDIVTPENIAFQYRLAGPFQRAPAYIIDTIIRSTVTVVLGCLGGFATQSLAPLLIFHFALEWFYGGVFEALWHGQTPGKRLFRLRVLTIHGQPINGLQAIMRNILRAADMMPVFDQARDIPILGQFGYTFQLGVLSCLLTSRYQRLGDLACGTMVVVEEPQRLYGVIRIDEPEAHRLAAELPPGFQVTRSQARALSQYVQRRRGFPWPRREEICRHMGEPLRQKFGLASGISYDLLICALYLKVFVEEHPDYLSAPPPLVSAPNLPPELRG